jgi:ABC-2 type transport system ATP-binding protein
MAARVGIVLQSWRDHGQWRVHRFLQHQGALYAPYGTADTSRPWPTAALLDAVGLTDQAGEQIRRLSGGQRRRLDLAVGLVGRPELLFLDEPTAGLDPQARRDFHDRLRHVASQTGVSVLLTTHDLDEAGKLAHRTAPHRRHRRRPHHRRRDLG